MKENAVDGDHHSSVRLRSVLVVLSLRCSIGRR